MFINRTIESERSIANRILHRILRVFNLKQKLRCYILYLNFNYWKWQTLNRKDRAERHISFDKKCKFKMIIRNYWNKCSCSGSKPGPRSEKKSRWEENRYRSSIDTHFENGTILIFKVLRDTRNFFKKYFRYQFHRLSNR